MKILYGRVAAFTGPLLIIAISASCGFVLCYAATAHN